MRVLRIVWLFLVTTVCVVAPASAETPVLFPDEPLQPVVGIAQNVSLKSVIASRIVSAAREAGANGFRISFPTIGMTAHTREGRDLMRLGDRWRIPMATMVAPREYLRAVAGDHAAQVLTPGSVLMGETSADLRDAQAGDTIVLRDARFRMKPFTIAAIVPNAFVDWGDIFIASEDASALGTFTVSRVAITNITSYQDVVARLRSKGIREGTTYRFRKSWDIPNPDGTLGTSTLKKKLGEFAYRPAGGSAIEIQESWRLSKIRWKHTFDDIKIRNNCHKVVIGAIQGALSEIKAKGLAKHVDVANANRYGGCYVGRYNRLAGSFGAPSRHAYGAAIDINTTQNYQWRSPKMNCDVVRIFRKWGFAWGGNFWPLDGMHFEYVGERRDNIGYPSRFCPNRAVVPAVALPQFSRQDMTLSTSTTTTSVPPLTSTP